MGLLHRLRVAVWGVPPDTAAERKLLFKIDFFVLTYVCLMYWVRLNPRCLTDISLTTTTRSTISTEPT